MKNRLVTIQALKYDKTVHRSWSCDLINETPEIWQFVGVFENEIKHPLLGVIRPGTVSHEYYWKNRWFNVFRFHQPEGSLRNFYCNVNLPPIFENDLLTYVDLDIDVLVAPDLSYQILDLDEFQENSRKHGYEFEVVERAKASLREIVALIENQQFPFDYTS